jgi:hypothetical protein
MGMVSARARHAKELRSMSPSRRSRTSYCRSRSTPPTPRVSRNSGRESQQARHKSNLIHIIQTNFTAAGRQKERAAGRPNRRGEPGDGKTKFSPFFLSFFSKIKKIVLIVLIVPTSAILGSKTRTIRCVDIVPRRLGSSLGGGIAGARRDGLPENRSLGQKTGGGSTGVFGAAGEMGGAGRLRFRRPLRYPVFCAYGTQIPR